MIRKTIVRTNTSISINTNTNENTNISNCTNKYIQQVMKILMSNSDVDCGIDSDRKDRKVEKEDKE